MMRWKRNIVELLEVRALLSASYVIDGVQPASYDQPQIHVLFRRTAAGPALLADDGLGDTAFDVTAFLDTGSSGVVLSQETALGLNIASSTFNGQPVVYEDVGIGGAQPFDVSEPLYLNMAPFNENIDGTNEADFSQKFGPYRLQVNQQPADDLLGDPLDIIGMPAMQGKVVVMDPTPINDLANMRTYIYNPGTPFSAANAATNPGIPTTNLHVKLSYASFLKYTQVTPAGAPGPIFTSNPLVGPAPGVSGDTTPPIVIGQDGLTGSGSFLLDTGSQSSFISDAMAAKVHVFYQAGTEGTDDPVLVDGSGNVIPNQFSLQIGGIGGTNTVSGFYLDSLTLPTQEGTPIKFTHAPVLVTDVTLEDPTTQKTFTLDGDIGMNYFVSSSTIAGGVGDDHPGDFDWITFDQPKGLLGLNLAGATTVQTGSIAGRLFKDNNLNHVQDSGEAGFVGATVYLDANKNGKFDAGEVTSLTDASGNYKFAGLNAGTYRVRESTPSGYTIGAPAAGYFDVTVAAGQDITGQNFADVPVRASISGNIFNDLNADGTRQSTEALVAGWKVYLDTNNNGKLDAGETSILTNSAGAYTFSNLLSGSYTVRDVLPTGWRATTAASAVVALTGVNAVGRNFGATQKAKISGFVYVDTNKNGIKDSNEAGLANWRVYLDANNNGKFDTGEVSVLTSSLGAWTINALAAGKYVVRVVQQTGYAITHPTAGYYSATLTAGATPSALLFGERKIA